MTRAKWIKLLDKQIQQIEMQYVYVADKDDRHLSGYKAMIAKREELQRRKNLPWIQIIMKRG